MAAKPAIICDKDIGDGLLGSKDDVIFAHPFRVRQTIFFFRH